MSRIIFCHFYNKDAEGLDFQTYPGKLGERIYNEISKQAWNEWISKQTMLINEKKLNMTDPTHRELLKTAMVKFLFEGSEITIKGFTPQKQTIE